MTEDRRQRTDRRREPNQLSKLLNILRNLTLDRFYGSILIRFEKGKIVSIKKEENLKLG